MTNYRRYKLEGGVYFFTVNIAERRKTLLTDRIQVLREAFRQRVGWVEAIAETHQHIPAND